MRGSISLMMALGLLACAAADEHEHGDPNEIVNPAPCHVGGCSSQICTDRSDLGSTCEWLPEYACYRTATCERQASGECGWTKTPELVACIDAAREHGSEQNAEPAPCYVRGCSSQLCTDRTDIGTTCEWAPVYACYRTAMCERQANGECGWTQTPELVACIDAARPR